MKYITYFTINVIFDSIKKEIRYEKNDKSLLLAAGIMGLSLLLMTLILSTVNFYGGIVPIFDIKTTAGEIGQILPKNSMIMLLIGGNMLFILIKEIIQSIKKGETQ
jgi:hypothetical protein